jgi:hypothetical protein
MRIVKDRATHHRELVLAHRTFKPCPVFHPRDAVILAAGARHTFRPTEPLKQLAATVVSRKHRINFRECHG